VPINNGFRWFSGFMGRYAVQMMKIPITDENTFP
jgi:hypothetical protein